MMWLPDQSLELIKVFIEASKIFTFDFPKIQKFKKQRHIDKSTDSIFIGR